MKKNLIEGHTKELSHLEHLLSKNKLASSMLFIGEEGIGKSLVAESISRSILCESEITDGSYCGICGSCLLLEHNNHPDYFYLNLEDKDESKIERLRELLQDINLISYRGKGKVILLNSVDNISISGANVLLKSLEEPRPGTYFILITSRPAHIPQTIFSRCQIHRFSPLTSEQIKNILQKKSLSVPNPDLLDLADGSVKRAIELSTEHDKFDSINSLLPLLITNGAQERYNLINKLGKERPELKKSLELFVAAARLRIKTTQEPHELRRYSALLTNLLSAMRLIFDRNLNSTLVLNNIFLSFDSDFFTNDITDEKLIDTHII